MKVIFDTNLLISAAIRDRLPDLVIKDIFLRPDITCFISQKIFDEYIDVLNRPKFNLPPQEIRNWIINIQLNTNLIKITKKYSLERDLKDSKYIECALSGNADYIVSGDKDLLEFKHNFPFQIVTPKQFWDILNSENAN